MSAPRTSPRPYRTFGSFIAAARIKAGWPTQAALACNLGLAQQSIATWEAGNQLPKPAYWEPLAQLLNLPPADLRQMAEDARLDRLSAMRAEPHYDSGSAPVPSKGKRIRNDPLQAETRRRMRAKIKAAARALFLKEPYDKVTFRRIAAAIGHAPIVIVYYYQTKKDLWRETMGCPPPTDSQRAPLTRDIEKALHTIVTAYRADDLQALEEAVTVGESLLAQLQTSPS